ncbi:SWIM zinc finger family protein [Paenibacillus mendelii]|uniref:SWIM zinc finger domain-containing protein n=1 Tax=Paenibacillus mendelii TaxID=206163 RepID=A0ABV6JLC2_9BACL|nr:SWIM zinc finger family protein [Paenibacillus mendelii]MCQ6562362.1 SWIM zinc finger family protein [Paenibacillus mendelii]
MKPIYAMDDTQWLKLLRDVGEDFNDVTIMRGFQYYKQGRVHRLTMPDSEHIDAIVEGTENYRVSLQLNALLVSHCTCPVGTCCKHMLAVLLDYANQQGRPIHALVNAKTNAAFQQPAKSPPLTASSGKANPADRARQAKELAELQEQARAMLALPILEWHKLFARCTAPMANHTPNGHYVQIALTAINGIKPPLSPAMEQLFNLHAHLFILEKLLRQSQQTWSQSSSVYMGYHTHVAADDVQEALGRCFAEELAVTTEPGHWLRVTETLDYVRGQMLTEAQNLFYFSDLYYRMWENWIRPSARNKELYEEELRQLKSAAAAHGSTPSQLQWKLAQVWMHFNLGQDPEAWELLRTVDNLSSMKRNPIYPLLDALSKAEEWPRLQAWLSETGSLLYNHRADSLNEYGRYWETTVQHHPEAEASMWEAYDRLSPYSRSIYVESLLTYGKWRQWIDYQLSTGNEPLEFRVGVLQPIEKEAPELLLPFYHQAVERYIAQKNRDSYKAAVKLLKRLSKLYRKLKQESRWELFLTAFTGRYSRLRALQEELRKGKLIS